MATDTLGPLTFWGRGHNQAPQQRVKSINFGEGQLESEFLLHLPAVESFMKLLSLWTHFFIYKMEMGISQNHYYPFRKSCGAPNMVLGTKTIPDP